MQHSRLAKTIATAMVIGAGFAPSAQALHLNPNGIGQVLVYPYYTVNAGNQTLLSVVNKTDAGKAIKLRFREGRNSRKVLEFNLYLSPFDVWTGTLFSLTDIGPANPANLVTTDNSCTVPRIKGNTLLPVLANGNRYVPFSNDSYSGASDEAGPNNLERTREGHFELIEMGEVANLTRYSLTVITHGAMGVPANCAQIQRAWLPISSVGQNVAYWSNDPLTDLLPPKGGLFGSAAIIDALAGTMLSYNAEAIDAFSDITQHTGPSAAAPTLASAHSAGAGGEIIANVFQEGSLVSSRYPAARGIDAVSALFVKEELFNEFTTSAALGATSEWIVSFPTKYAYVDQAIVGANAIAPFTRIFPTVTSGSNNGTAAVDMALSFFNREEKSGAATCTQPTDPACIPFFPPPPGESPYLYWSTNVIGFNQPNVDAIGSALLGSHLATHIDASAAQIEDGWALFQFYSASAPSGSLIDQHTMRADSDGGIWRGLPAIGFWATMYTNNQVMPGVLSRNADLSKLRGSNRYQITAAPTGTQLGDNKSDPPAAE